MLINLLISYLKLEDLLSQSLVTQNLLKSIQRQNDSKKLKRLLGPLFTLIKIIFIKRPNIFCQIIKEMVLVHLRELQEKNFGLIVKLLDQGNTSHLHNSDNMVMQNSTEH
jgi:hypothetical protein